MINIETKKFMFIIGKNIDQISSEDIKRLVDNRVQEHRGLDYKRDLRLSQDKDKKEFLYDITSMANTEGGTFVFGIEESKDEKGQNTGAPESVFGIEVDNTDKLTQQIEDIIKWNTDPSITRVFIRFIVVDDKTVLLIGIPKTYGLPIMVTFNESNKFYRRRNTGKYSVDTYELSEMFLQNQLLTKSAEKYRRERVNEIIQNQIFPNVVLTTVFVVQIIPFTFQRDKSLDLSSAGKMNLHEPMKPFFSNGWDCTHTVDGYCCFSTNKQGLIAFDQICRNGVYEIFSSELFSNDHVGEGRVVKRLYGKRFIEELCIKMHSAFNVLKKFDVEGPFLICMTLIGHKDGVIYDDGCWTEKQFLTNQIYFPPIVATRESNDFKNLLKTNFDILWQAVGHAKSPD